MLYPDVETQLLSLLNNINVPYIHIYNIEYFLNLRYVHGHDTNIRYGYDLHHNGYRYGCGDVHMDNHGIDDLDMEHVDECSSILDDVIWS